MRANQYRKSEATEKSAFDLNESSIIQPNKQHTLDYLPLSKNKRFQSVNMRSNEKRPIFESNLDGSEGSRLKRYDEMIKKMQSKQLSKFN